MYKYFSAAVFSLCTLSAVAQHSTGATKVYFDLNVMTLDATAKHTIDSLLKVQKITNNKNLMLYGYSDYLGTAGHDDTVSNIRANNVKKYLISKGVPTKSVTICLGKGKIEKPPLTEHVGYREDRRVEIYIENKINLDNVKKNGTLALKNIFFEPGRHAIHEESKAELEVLYNYLKKHKKVKIQLEGHICCPNGSPDGYDYDSQEYKLSTNRAKAVYDYLIGKGIDATRMGYEGFARTRPIVQDEKTAEDENMNRRVEVRITDK